MKPISFIIGCAIAFTSFISCSQGPTETNHSVVRDTVQEPQTKDLAGLSVATFSSGCFWCMEGVYESVKGVKEAVSGYAGGTEPNPTYEEVGSGKTGHAESVQVFYDSTKVSFETLVKVYFASQDPTQVNGQGPDYGKQYRSIIFYNNEREKQIAQAMIDQLNKSGELKGPVAAQVLPYEKFWHAENYHQDYIEHNENDSYVLNESIPRIKKFQQKYPELIKEDKKY